MTGAAHAVPPTVGQQQLWDGFFARHYGGSRLARRIFASTGVDARHAAVSPLDEDLSQWGTAARMQRYLIEALPLGKEAVSAALDAGGVDPENVGLFAVASCTGYVTPGVDIRLACDVGMSSTVQRVLVGHMGCYAAIPGLGVVRDFVLSHRQPAVLLCLELTSLHVQPPTADVDQLVAHALFSDAAAAVVVQPDVTGGLEVVDVAARTDIGTADHMTWDVTDLGFRMGLSPLVPDVLSGHVRDVVAGLLARHGLAAGDVRGWAVHPGGPRILDVVADRLDLDDGQLVASRNTLRLHGNCSSSTVLLVLEELQRVTPLAAGEHALALAFGPGLTLYACLLRAV